MGETLPPLRILESDGSPNAIPVYTIEIYLAEPVEATKSPALKYLVPITPAQYPINNLNKVVVLLLFNFIYCLNLPGYKFIFLGIDFFNGLKLVEAKFINALVDHDT